MELVTRQDAIKQNMTHYFTGKPCKRGHFSVRFVGCRSCYTCTVEKATKKTPAQKKAYKKSWESKNKEKVAQHKTSYRKRHPNIVKGWHSKRRAIKINALPTWANMEKIKEIYKNCPKGMHVDHIVPLQSELVCGLHVENNLQYLTPKENQSKGNKYQPL